MVIGKHDGILSRKDSNCSCIQLSQRKFELSICVSWEWEYPKSLARILILHTSLCCQLAWHAYSFLLVSSRSDGLDKLLKWSSCSALNKTTTVIFQELTWHQQGCIECNIVMRTNFWILACPIGKNYTVSIQAEWFIWENLFQQWMSIVWSHLGGTVVLLGWHLCVLYDIQRIFQRILKRGEPRRV